MALQDFNKRPISTKSRIDLWKLHKAIQEDEIKHEAGMVTAK